MLVRAFIQSAALGALLVASSLAFAGCEFGKTTVGLGRPTLVVRSVLNPAQPVEIVLVERSLTGAIVVDTTQPYDPRSPIATGGGIPLSGAHVVLFDDRGDSAIAREAQDAGGSPGVYLVRNSALSSPEIDTTIAAPLPIVSGRRYHLRVVTPDGDVVTGVTTIPGDSTIGIQDTPIPTATFDRAHDTLALSWPARAGARSYLLQVGTPFNTYSRLVDTLSYSIPGDARNTDAGTLAHLFIPGFSQLVIVGAVDSNYYDYVRFRATFSTISGRVNRLTGGIGVFGAYVPLVSREISVTAPATLPLEGTYQATSPPSGIPSTLRLYVESPAGSNGLGQLSGNYHLDTFQGGIIGVYDGARVTLDVLSGESVLDTLLVIDGTVSGGTIQGTVRRSGEQVTYVKAE